MINLIAAIDSTQGIATDLGIPWDIPKDKSYFREKTSNFPILMGSGVYNEFAAPLANRENYVLTRSSASLRKGFTKVTDLVVFIQQFKDQVLWIIGGAQVYAQTINYADKLYLTQIEGDFHCTKFFPEYKNTFYKTDTSDTQFQNDIEFHFETWERKRSD